MTAQLIAIIIFVLMFLLIISEKIERHIVAVFCGVAVFVFVFGFGMKSPQNILKTLNLGEIFTLNFWLKTKDNAQNANGISWATIIFIFGMMVMVEGMAKSGFFRWLCLWVAKTVGYKTKYVFITFMIMSFLLAMFIDSITVILFLAAATVELAKMLKFDPVPVILSEIFCANLGGSATMCGDPPNIIIGTSLGFSFFDFLTNTGIIAVISLLIIVPYFYICFKDELLKNIKAKKTNNFPKPKDAIKSKKEFALSTFIFSIAVLLLTTHSKTGFTVAFIGAFIAILTLLLVPKGETINVLKLVDYKTLVFFAGLFVVVDGLEQTGVLKIIAEFMKKISGGNIYAITALIIWVSGTASAFIDNIPFAATMIPVISSIATSSSLSLNVLAWALAVGTDIGGSATPVGASANVVGMSVAAKEGYVVGWGRYCRSMAAATIIVLFVSMIYMWFVYV